MAIENYAKILQELLPGSQFIKVEDATKTKRWKHVDSVKPETDTVQYSKSGKILQMSKKPGRPKKIEPDPDETELAERDHKRVLTYQMRRDHIRNSALVRSVKKDPESLEILQNLMHGLAEEVEALIFDRRVAEKNGQPTEKISSKKVAAQKALSEVYLKLRAQNTTRELDLNSPAVKNFLGFVVETFKGSMKEAEIRPDEIKLVLIKLAEAMNTEAWLLRARKRMRGDDDGS